MTPLRGPMTLDRFGQDMEIALRVIEILRKWAEALQVQDLVRKALEEIGDGDR